MPQCQDWREVTTQDAVNPIESLAPLPPGCILEPGLDKLRALPPLALVLCDTGQALLEKLEARLL